MTCNYSSAIINCEYIFTWWLLGISNIKSTRNKSKELPKIKSINDKTNFLKKNIRKLPEYDK